MNEKLTGSCLCGRIKYTIALDKPAEEIDGNYCHCGQCRKASGSVMASFLTVPKKSVTFNEAPKSYESSKDIYRQFCPSCGSQLCWDESKTDLIDIGIGTLDQPDKIKPKTHMWVENKILINHDLPKYLQSSKGELLHE